MEREGSQTTAYRDKEVDFWREKQKKALLGIQFKPSKLSHIIN